MSAEILEFKRKKKESKPKPDITLLSNQELHTNILTDVLLDWQQAAVKNKLNDYVLSILPKAIKNSKYDYINCLNTISEVEEHLKILVFSCSPEYLTNIGWQAGFKYNKEVFVTPPDLSTEAHARALNVVLFLKFDLTMKTLNK
jgi:hypothetical protein